MMQVIVPERGLLSGKVHDLLQTPCSQTSSFHGCCEHLCLILSMKVCKLNWSLLFQHRLEICLVWVLHRNDLYTLRSKLAACEWIGYANLTAECWVQGPLQVHWLQDLSIDGKNRRLDPTMNISPSYSDASIYKCRSNDCTCNQHVGNQHRLSEPIQVHRQTCRIHGWIRSCDMMLVILNLMRSPGSYRMHLSDRWSCAYGRVDRIVQDHADHLAKYNQCV